MPPPITGVAVGVGVTFGVGVAFGVGVDEPTGGFAPGASCDKPPLAHPTAAHATNTNAISRICTAIYGNLVFTALIIALAPSTPFTRTFVPHDACRVSIPAMASSAASS